MLVTHDQRLITLVCNEMWICEDAKVTVFEGDFEVRTTEKVVFSFLTFSFSSFFTLNLVLQEVVGR